MVDIVSSSSRFSVLSWQSRPQRLKPDFLFDSDGTTEVVPFPFVLGSCLGTRYSRLDTAFQYQPIGASFRLMWTCLVSRYSSIPQGPSSRPNPDCLKPPHGASTYVGCMWLTHTMPARKAFTVRIALKMSRVQTAAANPYGESFAIFIASFSSSNGITA